MNQFPATFPGLDVSAPPTPPGPAPPGPATFTSRAAWTNPAFFVDPSNSSGLANDANSGLTALTPIRTTAEFNRRIFLHDVRVTCIVTYMSDCNPAEELLDLSTVAVSHGAALTFQGTPQTTHTGGTVTVVSSINPLTNTRQVMSPSDLPNFNAFTDQLVVNTNAARLNHSAWIVSPAAGAASNFSRPITPAITAGAFVTGDGYKIQRGSFLLVGSASPVPLGPASPGLLFNDFTFLALSPAGPPSWIDYGLSLTWTRCLFQDAIGSEAGTNFVPFFAHCDVSNNIESPLGEFFFTAGVLRATLGFAPVALFLAFDSDTYVTGLGLINSTFDAAAIVVQANLGNGVQLQDTTNTDGALYTDSTANNAGAPSAILTPGLIWGTGNAGPGLGLGPGAELSVSAAGASSPRVTGTGGDFAFKAQNGGAMVQRARPWNEAAGIYGPSIATTWANFAAPAPAFAFQAHSPATRASIVGI